MDAGDGAGQRGLAAARLPHQGDTAAGADLEIDAVQGLGGAVEGAHALGRHHRSRRAPARVARPARDEVVLQTQPGDLLPAPAAHAVLLGSLVGREGLDAAGFGVVAAVGEGAPRRAFPGQRRAAGDAAQRVLAGEVRDGGEQAARVGMVRAAEEGVTGAHLHEPSRVHHGDPVGQVGDHGEVVGHVESGHPVGARQVLDGAQHVRLGRHVETRRGLVEDDQRGPARERHGDGDALLLAAGELVRVAAQELPVAGQQHLGHHLPDALCALRVRGAEPVHLEDLPELRPDA